MFDDQLIDAVCDRFESELRRGHSPALSEFLGEAPEATRCQLMYELLVTEIEFKVRRGDSVYLDEVLVRFPNHKEVVFKAFGSFIWEGAARPIVRNSAADVFDLMLRHFRLKALIGRGAFGNVWLADDTRLDREVAIKTCHSYDGVRPQDLDVAVCEAQASATLRHQNILPVHEVNEQDGCWFLVTAFASNGTLRQLIQHNPPDLDEVVRIVAKLADAVQHAHAKGVCHRDLKPSNILIDAQGEPLIADFGLATTLRRQSDVPAGLVCGTRRYMAPEQQLGRFGGERADLYSLGVVLEDLLESTARADVPTPRGRREKMTRFNRRLVRQALNLIQRQCCHLDPAERYSSAQALAEDLKRMERGRAPKEVQLSWKSHGQWFACRHLTAIGAGLLALAATVAIAFANGPPPPPNSRLVRFTTEPSRCEVIVVAMDRLTGEPDPQRIVRAHGRTPTEMYLIPGDYLTIAIQDEEHFHEVQRHVPETSEWANYSAKYRSWKERDGVIELPVIRLKVQPIPAELVQVPETTDLLVSASARLNQMAERVDIPSFKVAKTAFTMGLGPVPHGQPEGSSGPVARPVIQFNYDDAVRAAEMKGLRLPTAAECCALQLYADGLQSDGMRTEPDQAIWTSSRLGAPGTGLMPPKEYSNRWSNRLLATSPMEDSQNPLGERVHHPAFVERDGRARDSGTVVLGVRSARPRRTPEDFARSEPRIMTESGEILRLSSRPSSPE